MCFCLQTPYYNRLFWSFVWDPRPKIHASKKHRSFMIFSVRHMTAFLLLHTPGSMLPLCPRVIFNSDITNTGRRNVGNSAPSIPRRPHLFEARELQQERRVSPGSTPIGHMLELFTALCMSVNDPKSPVSMDWRVAKRLQQVDEFANTQSTNEDGWPPPNWSPCFYSGPATTGQLM